MNYELDGFRRFDAGIGIGAALDFPHWIVGVDADFGCMFLKYSKASSAWP